MASEALKAAGMTGMEIAAIPTRRTWYAIVGTADSELVPKYLTEDLEYAKAKALVANREWATLGPWSVVTLFENLRLPQ